MKQEMHHSYARDLESVDLVPRILNGSQQLFDLVRREECSEPVPFILVFHVKAHIAVGSFVAGSTIDDRTQGGFDCLSEGRDVNGVVCFVGGLGAVCLGHARWVNCDDFLWISCKEVYSML